MEALESFKGTLEEAEFSNGSTVMSHVTPIKAVKESEKHCNCLVR